ncbi:unnamed protein product [Linum trigynum]|uniref:Uncharacterized protein n=1 Tax=Linum trigynum TaxID=586398 RepID=A0AAV2FKS3_9ROSI
MGTQGFGLRGKRKAIKLLTHSFDSSAVAFASAIEILPLSSSFFTDNQSTAIPPGGAAAGFFGFPSSALLHCWVLQWNLFTGSSSRDAELLRMAFIPLAPKLQDPQDIFFNDLQFLAKLPSRHR